MKWGKIEFSRADKLKGLRLPEVNEKLAYLCGVLAGDGCLHCRWGKDYEINCGGNPHNEREFYDVVIKRLMKELFGLQIKMRLIGNKSTYGFVLYSKSLYLFLTQKVGLPSGKKHPSLRIPSCFNTTILRINFLRGVADTDFSFVLKKTNKEIGHYPSIVGASKTKEFLLQLYDILKEVNFNPHLSLEKSYFDKRYNKNYTINRIELVGHSNVDRWMLSIGFRNPKYLKKYQKYKKIRKMFLK